MSNPTKCPFCGSELSERNDSFYAWGCGSVVYNNHDSAKRQSVQCLKEERKILKARIARLEEAGDMLFYYCKFATLRDEWRKAKL